MNLLIRISLVAMIESKQAVERIVLTRYSYIKQR